VRLPRRKRDLVEEFWDEDTLAECRPAAVKVGPTEFLDGLRTLLGATGRMWATPYARVALREFLSRVVPADRGCVLVCSLNCRAVAEAVQRAGLRVDTYDLGDPGGWVDWASVAEQLRPWHGAVVVTHLFGVPYDFRPLREGCRSGRDRRGRGLRPHAGRRDRSVHGGHARGRGGVQLPLRQAGLPRWRGRVTGEQPSVLEPDAGGLAGAEPGA
jgi:hypothetical protein